MQFSKKLTIPQLVFTKTMTSEPFLCKERRVLAPHLKGITVDIQDMLRPLSDSLCIFGGDECQFEDRMSFMRAARGYQFIFASGVWFLPNWTTENITASSALFEEELTFVGRKDAQKKISRAIGIIVRPFHLWTWLVILIGLIVAVVVYVLLAVYFARPRTVMNVCRHLLLDFSQSRNTERERMLNNVAVRTHIFAVTAS